MIDSSLFSVVLFRIIKDIHTTTTTLVAVAVFFFFFLLLYRVSIRWIKRIYQSKTALELSTVEVSWVALAQPKPSHTQNAISASSLYHDTQQYFCSCVKFCIFCRFCSSPRFEFVQFYEFLYIHIYIYCFIACFFALGADRYGREWIECVLCCVLVLVRYRERMRDWDGRLTKANAAPRKKWFVTKNKKNNKKNKV